jgi:cobalamin biosynthesis Mg chelatase CobN
MIVGTRQHPAPILGRPVVVLMSVVVLLALACFPVLAHAEDSSGVQYSDAIPKAEGENSPAHPKRPPIAKAADNGDGPAPEGTKGSQGSKESTGASPESESTEKNGGVATTNGNNSNGGGNGQGNPGGSGNGKANAPVQHAGQPKGTPTSQQSSDSSSSPLIPILIAILALAAISVAAVMIRQKRQRRGPTASAPSPKAS